MATFQYIVNHALWELGTLGNGLSASASATEQAIGRLIDWLDNESISGLLQSKRVRRTHKFTASQMAYTFSSTDPMADIALDFPADLELVTFQMEGELDARPLDRTAEFSLLQSASVNGISPTRYAVDLGEPARIAFDAPPMVGDMVTLVGGEWLTGEVSTIMPNHETGLPRGYNRALILCLAKELAPSYGVNPNRETTKNMMDARKKLLNRNVAPHSMVFDRGLARIRHRPLN